MKATQPTRLSGRRLDNRTCEDGQARARAPSLTRSVGRMPPHGARKRNSCQTRANLAPNSVECVQNRLDFRRFWVRIGCQAARARHMSGTCERGEMLWHAMPQDHETWPELESAFVSRALRVSARQLQALPPGRNMMPDTRIPPADARPGTRTTTSERDNSGFIRIHPARLFN